MNGNNVASLNKQKEGMPWWLWVFLATIAMSLLLGGYERFQSFMTQEENSDPFMNVSNRQFSLFLWQFPEYMKVNASDKSSYLRGFMPNQENFSSDTSEDCVDASFDLLFLYHTWARLLFSDPIGRPIPPEEFKQFLTQFPEWHPKNWKEAPKPYVQLVSRESYLATRNMQELPDATLPKEVRAAFFGWKNYFVEGTEINAVKFTYAELLAFLEKHPTYQRSYWRNISEVQGKKVAGLNYLSSLLKGGFSSESVVPREQLAPFLIVAYYNAKKAAQEL